jgi:DNA-directed RNA polymerase specialized sigma24 family protein
MYDSDPGLSSDLEWLILSGQVSQQALAKALVDVYFSPIYRLALAVLGEPIAARLAAQETFTSLLLNLHTYSNQTGVKCWLYGFAMDAIQLQARRLKSRGVIVTLLPKRKRPSLPGDQATRNETQAAIWQAFDSLDETQRIPVFLFYVQGWPVPEIASLMHSRDYMNNTSNARLSFLGALQGVGQDLEVKDLDLLLADSLQRRWPLQEIPDSNAKTTIAEILREVERRTSSRRTVISFKEVLLVSAAVLIAIGLIWRSNMAQPAPTSTIAAEGTRPAATPTHPTAIASYPTGGPTGLPFVVHIPTRTPTPSPTPQGVFYYVQPGDTVASIAARMGISVNDLIDWNRLSPGTILQPGLALVDPRGLTPSLNETFTPIPPSTPIPLRSPPSSADVSQYLQDMLEMKFWKSVWFDAQLVYYGPPGYLGPKQVYRLQAWFSEDQFLLVGGPPQRKPDEVLLSDKYHGIYIARPAEGKLWFSEMIDYTNLFKTPIMNAFAMLLFADSLRLYDPQGYQYQSQGNELIKGKVIAVFDQTDLYGNQNLRLWLDPRGGFILRQQHFTNTSPKSLLVDSQITSIAYNVDFPVQLFDPQIPWRGGFAADYTGRPEPARPTLNVTPTPGYKQPITKFPPPENFDASHSPLTFQFPPEFNHFSAFDEDQRYAYPDLSTDLFADGYFLGEVQMSDPFNMICARSPDGQRIAFTNVPTIPFSPLAPLHWFSLSDTSRVVSLPGDFLVNEFAFAPDSRHLAFFGSNAHADRKLYLLDTDTGTTIPLLDLSDSLYGTSLVWSPDGKYLVFLNLYDSGNQYRPQVFVLRIENWQVIDRYQFDLGAPDMQASLPFPSSWMGKFPVAMGGLEACSQAPKGNQ